MKNNNLVHIHEAGHAVAALHFGVSFKSVDIIPEYIYHVPGHSSGGLRRCELSFIERSYADGIEPSIEGYFKRDCIILMAGIVCEAKYKNKKFILCPDMIIDDGMSDLQSISELSKIAICNDTDVIGAYMNYVASLTVFLFNGNPGLWQVCKEIATKLLSRKSLTHKECLRIYNEILNL